MADSFSSQIRAAVAGDGDALERLLSKQARSLRLFVRSQIRRDRGVVDTDDILQDTYRYAFRRIRAFEPRTEVEFAAWLKQIARNKIRDAFKRQRPIVEFESRMGRHDSGPSEKVRRIEQNERLLSAVRKLPARYRDVVEAHLNGEPVEEMAARKKCSAGAIYMLLLRARKYLAELLPKSLVDSSIIVKKPPRWLAD